MYSAKGGRLVSVTIAATAGNVVTNKSPGTGKRWYILYGEITLINDATVADRNVYISLTDGTNELTALGRNQTAYTAGQTRTIYLVPMYATDQDWAWLSATLGSAGSVSPNAIIEGADQIRITIGNGQAGDSYSGHIRVLELAV